MRSMVDLLSYNLHFMNVVVGLISIVAFIVLCIEIFINKKAITYNSHQFWLLLDQLIDGKRQFCHFNDA